MGIAVRVFVVIVALGLAALLQNYRQLKRPMGLPHMDYKAYWGPDSGVDYKENTAIRTFDISADQKLIEDLKAQLQRPLRLHEPLEGVGFEYGFNSKELKKVVKYWRDSYLPKWNERQTYLKKFPHFQTQIQGLNLHYIHVKPKKTDSKKVIPLLLLHGWPGSVREFYDFIPMLTTPQPNSEYVFEIIAPSLPGYGWSQGASKTGFGPTSMAVVLRNLMLRVGHNKFIVQGGDWGSIIGACVATIFPENVIAYHSNMCNSNHPLSRFKLLASSLFKQYATPKEFGDFYKSFGGLFSHILEESGYMHLQATKPDTIGSALAQTPVGLAVYILEKFSTWTNIEFRNLEDGGLTQRYTYDALLDNVMIYYLTNSITTSQRLYAEAFNSAEMGREIDRVTITVPSGCARFKHDLMHSTDWALEDRFVNLIHSTHHKDGGHFPAMEIPKTLYADFIEFLNKAFKVNQQENA